MTLSTADILRHWLADIEDGSRPTSHNGRVIETAGYTCRLARAWRATDLAEYRPAARGRPALWLINGDRIGQPGPFQPDTQWVVRAAVQPAAARMNVPAVLIPFSALAGAGVDRSSIRLIDVRPDTNWTEERTAAEWRHVPIRERTYTKRVDRSSRSIEDVAPNSRRTWRTVDGTSQWADIEPDEDGLYHWPTWPTFTKKRDEDGLYRWTVHLHRLGDCVFTADVVSETSRRRDWTVRDVVRTAADIVYAESQSLADSRITYRGRRQNPYATSFHEIEPASRRLENLDMAPIVERVQTRRRRRFVSSFDVAEPMPAYFLATLPGSSRARTVDMAIEDLAPAAVHAALARGRDVRRQGDIFFIGTDLADETIGAMAKTRARLTLWTRHARPRPDEPTFTPAPAPKRERARRRARRQVWRRLIRDVVAAAEVSGHARPRTLPGHRQKMAAERERYAGIYAGHMARARTAVLQGDDRAAANSRRHAENYRPALASRLNVTAGRDDYRKGYGSNAASAWRRADEETRATFYRPPTFEDRRAVLRAALSVHGTAHSATEVVKTRDGRVYVRGIVRHEPDLIGENRGRDHVPVRLGTGWYLAVRNTVPRLQDGRL